MKKIFKILGRESKWLFEKAKFINNVINKNTNKINILSLKYKLILPVIKNKKNIDDMVRVIKFINKFPAKIAIGKTKNKINNIFSKKSNLSIKSLLFFIWKIGCGGRI